jgi:pteridine reductase
MLSSNRMNTNVAAPALKDQVVLITGGAKRLGAVVARALHREGARLLIHYHRSEHEARALAAELNGLRPGSALIHRADLLDSGQAPAIVDAALRAHSRLDILINNASSFYPTPVGSITQAQWDDLMGSNLKAPLFLSQAAAPHLKRSRGLIINMIDIHASRPLKHHMVYCAAKAGLAMLTRSLARELGPQVRVNGIAPGPVLWPESPLEEDLKTEIVGKTALKRHGTPEDIARTVLFLAKDAPYITGQIIAVDGGRSI